jgi:hypothetical protein
MSASQQFIVGGQTVSLANGGSFSCTCVLYKRAGKCGYIILAQRKLADQMVPRFVTVEPVKPRQPIEIQKRRPPSALAEVGEFGKRKIRKD